jgi:hypothetical protein
MKLTLEQQRVLDIVRDKPVAGVCVRGAWVFQDKYGQTLSRRTIKALENRNLVAISYYSGGKAAVNATSILR